jgi:cell division septation protein DedD
MSYDFSFDRKSISLLLGGLAFVGVMLFIAGLLVGASWSPETTPAPTALAGGRPAAAVTPAPVESAAPLPNDPALNAAAAAGQDSAAPGGGGVAVAGAPAPGAVPTASKQAHNAGAAGGASGASGASGGAGAAAANAPAAPPAGNYDDVRLVEEAQPSASAGGGVSAPQTYSVQVEVFADKNEADQLVRQLRDKGYAPIIFEGNDYERRRRYAVRVGSYANRTEADQSAAAIARQENRKTVVVRPFNSL